MCFMVIMVTISRDWLYCEGARVHYVRGLYWSQELMRGDIFVLSFYTLFPLNSLSTWSIKCGHYRNHASTFYRLKRLCNHLFYALTHHFFIFIILQTGYFQGQKCQNEFR